jgi:exodeoxyribonuclease V beta subunit
MANFDPITVPLQGNNIVEASAGTGKTFSIGLLVLRLLLEKKVPVDKILMVTFTNAAVAELAARIRSFISKAIKVAEGAEIKKEDEDIKIIVDKYGDEEALILLKNALTDLDKASIQTIHSFCQDSLNTYALNSGQAFGLELQPEVMAIAGDEVRKFWRQNITVLPEELLRESGEICFENFEAVVKETIGGKKYAHFANEDFEVGEFGERFVNFYRLYQQNKNHILQQIQNYNLRADWKAGILKDASSFAGYCSILLTDAPTRVKLSDLLFGDDKALVIELFSNKEACCHWLFSLCIKTVTKKIDNYLQEKHLITYDELIIRMHAAVTDENTDDLKNTLKEKYSAVFIDEFQDTDKLQYEIYDKLFGDETTLFYIGDPKQSIYAWRKADLHTYFQAKGKIPVERHYEMDKNYRSSTAYVTAVEEFYSRCDDPFNTANSGLDLNFISVEAHNSLSTGLKKDASELRALQIFDGETKAKIKPKIPKLVYEILEGGYLLNGKDVKNSDIGILVRTNKEAVQIKGLLADAGIHAITIDENQVFKDSQEAKSLRYILQAVLETTAANINKALLNTFTGYSAKEVAGINKEDLLDIFRIYREKWTKSGVYPMVKEFMKDFGVMRNLLEKSNENGLRILTDLTQILELLQEAEYRQELKPLGLYDFLGKQIAGELEVGDEYQQRMESDEAAVKIVTIHKAKGLEYSIVIAPFLDLKSKEENFIRTYSYREDGSDGQYKFYCRGLSDEEQKELALRQLEQENRRLLYVALTRAKFNCFLFKTSGGRAGITCLTPFTAEFDTHLCLEEPLPQREESGEKGQPKLPDYWGVVKKPENFSLSDKLYGKLSFSAISSHGTYTPKENTGKPEGYDEFIFKNIPKGITLGNMLHHLFENIDFEGTEEHHKEELEKLLDKYYPHKKEDLREGFLEMIEHVLDSNIKVDREEISLRKISNSKKKNEMEFDLRTQKVDLVGLNNFKAGEKIELGCNTQNLAKSGLLNGLIDLFFLHNGKYYILDWKSNYLGDNLSCYEGTDNLNAAMNEGNYHLQYLIYTVALKKYLEQRLSNFDYNSQFGGVIYMFLRGNRAGESSGVFTNKPTLDQIKALELLFRKEQLA